MPRRPPPQRRIRCRRWWRSKCFAPAASGRCRDRGRRRAKGGRPDDDRRRRRLLRALCAEGTRDANRAQRLGPFAGRGKRGMVSRAKDLDHPAFAACRDGARRDRRLGATGERPRHESLGEILAPAITLAEEGYIVQSRVAWDWTRNAGIAAKDPDAAKSFLVDGKAPVAGSRMRNPGSRRRCGQSRRRAQLDSTRAPSPKTS